MSFTGSSVFGADCRTTAMGIMPHVDVERALELATSLDIPYWPQLPNLSFHEDMYAQTSEGFPGISVDAAGQRVLFNSGLFEEEMSAYSEKMDDPGFFLLSEAYSTVYHRFLALDLKVHAAIRGQVTGPVSFGFRVVDETQKPIIYNDSVRTILFDFIQKKLNAQYRQLSAINPNAFVWADEPGLGWIFSGMSGYNDLQAKADYRTFLERIEGLKALHLCANVNLPFLLELGAELVSFDAYQIEVMPRAYASSVADFLGGGGVLAWGIVPTDSTNLSKENVGSLVKLVTRYWDVLSRESGIDVKQIARQSLLAPARCCLKNIGSVGSSDEGKRRSSVGCPISSVEEQLVEKAFVVLRGVSGELRDRFVL